eukprot:UN01423
MQQKVKNFVFLKVSNSQNILMKILESVDCQRKTFFQSCS